MSQFEKAVELSDEQFLRAVGVDKATFNLILERVAVHLESLRDEQPMKKRGRKSGLPLSISSDGVRFFASPKMAIEANIATMGKRGM